MNLGEWVPQLFYDLIARVTPGAALLTVGLAIFGHIDLDPITDKVLLGDENLPAVSLFIWALLASYVLGMLLSGVWYVPSVLRDGASRFLKRFLPDIGGAKWDGVPGSRGRVLRLLKCFLEWIKREEVRGKAQPKKYNFVHIRKPAAGARLAKLGAEAEFSAVMFVGLFLLALSYPWMRPEQYLEEWWPFVEGALAIGTVVAFCLRFHFKYRFDVTVDSNYEILLRDDQSRGAGAG